ncbi:MAG: helix-turn-helix domain-containing protein [Flavobacteriales bacterium]|nr:helix-turn-helix domain-containing protein [Flavobacteriales bacterium]
MTNRNHKGFLTLEFKPQLLSDYVQTFRYFKFQESKDYVWDPSGKFELIFQLKGQFSQSPIGQESWTVRPTVFVGGLHSESFILKAEKDSALLSIEFKSSGAKHFIKEGLNLFKNKVVDLDDVAPLFPSEVKEQLLKNLHNGTIVNCLESALIKHFREKEKSGIDLAAQLILQNKGIIKIGDLADYINLSPSQFRKRFNKEIGMSPKEYTKIIRIDTLIKQMKNSTALNLTAIGYQMGYFDQAHFIKDFVSVTGLSPRNYCKERIPFLP